MTKKRVYELAREYNVKNEDIIDVLVKNNMPAKNHLSGVEDSALLILEKAFGKGKEIKGASSGSKEDRPQKDQEKADTSVREKKEGQKQQARTNIPPEHKKAEQKTAGDGQKAGKSGFRHVQIMSPTQRRGQEGQKRYEGNRQRGAVGDRFVQPTRAGQSEEGSRKGVSRERRQDGRDVRDNRGARDFRDNRGQQSDSRSSQQPRKSFQQGQRPQQTQRQSFGAEPFETPTGGRTEGRMNKKDRRDRNKDKEKRGQGQEPKHKSQSLLYTSIAKSKNKVKLRNEQHKQQKAEERRKAEAAIATSIQLDGSLTVKEFAEKLGREVSEVIKKLMLLGVMATINQEIDLDTALVVADDFGVEVEIVDPEVEANEIEEIVDSEESLQHRPPVVTIMGHVDHGKTSLLDVIRQTNVIATEAGGITQHIGAYMVRYQGNKITFLDTPGHEAFTAMRLRGAQATDIAILVVAADDGVMPQTIEAINHAKSANVPIIVAINKMDKPGANPDHVKQQLAEHGLLPEEWGGDVIMVPVSAKQKMGIDDLLENILLVAEVMELKANPNRLAQGIIVEAQLDKGRGPVATVLVQKGTLRVGDTIIAGTAFGKVRAMTNERGEKQKIARPSMPVEVLGLSDVPAAGEMIYALEDNMAREVAEKRIAKQRVAEQQAAQKITLDDLFQQIKDGNLKELNIIIKADVQGSVEALRQSLEAIKNEEVRIVVVHSAVGAINESDVMLASASNALIIGFNVRPDATVRKAAERESVDLRTYRVMYDAINDVESAMRGMLTPEFKEVVLGRAEVRQVISTPKAIVAGSYVTEGKITNSADIRLIRDGIVVHEGKVDSLRRFKDEAKEVMTGFECGISIERYRDIKEGDIIEAFTMEEIAPVL